MKTPNDVQEEGFYSMPEDTNPYEEGTWAWRAWNVGRENGYSPKDYKQEFADKLVKYRTALANHCNAVREYKDALNSFNESLKCYGSIPSFVISYDGDLDNGWLVQPFNHKITIELDVHTITPLKDTVILDCTRT